MFCFGNSKNTSLKKIQCSCIFELKTSLLLQTACVTVFTNDVFGVHSHYYSISYFIPFAFLVYVLAVLTANVFFLLIRRHVFLYFHSNNMGDANICTCKLCNGLQVVNSNLPFKCHPNCKNEKKTTLSSLGLN